MTNIRQHSLFLLLGLLILIPLILETLAQEEPELDKIPDNFNHSYFPDDFLFGASSSAYQYEGAWNTSCDGPSIWDIFTHTHKHEVYNGSNGDVAVDFYHRYSDYLIKMKTMNMTAFRFSISWSRLVPSGIVRQGVNEEGIKFYKSLIDFLVDKGIEPYITLFHFDTPQGLEDKYGGFLSDNIVNDFKNYADFCFKTFGGKVRHWITFNEPYTFAIYSYDKGVMAPGRCSNWVNRLCPGGDSATEPYIVAHNILNAHAAAANVYKTTYKDSQKGKIGITLNCDWWEPFTNSSADSDAAQRGLDFMIGWFLDPITYGSYPRTMIDRVKERLPPFEDSEIVLLKGSIDFLGLNYYTAEYGQDNSSFPDPDHVRALTDPGVNLLVWRGDKPIGPPYPASSALRIVPWGIRKLLKYINETYVHPEIHITENGVDRYDNGTMTIPEAQNDTVRKEYYLHHIWNVYRAMNEFNVNVKAFLIWSLLDNFEWVNGYAYRFGIIYVDYKNNMTTYYKDSAMWFQRFLRDPLLDDEGNQLHKNM